MGIRWSSLVNLEQTRQLPEKDSRMSADTPSIQTKNDFRRLVMISVAVVLFLCLLFLPSLNPTALLFWSCVLVITEPSLNLLRQRFAWARSDKSHIVAAALYGLLAGLAPLWILPVLSVQQLFLTPLALLFLSAAAAMLLSNHYKSAVVYISGLWLPLAVLSQSIIPNLDPRWLAGWSAAFFGTLLVARIYTRQTSSEPDQLRQAQEVLEENQKQLSDYRQQLRFLSHSDQLTTLCNRDYFHLRLNDLLSAGRPLALLVINLDRFQQVNEGLGHSYGDRLLQQAARRLQRNAYNAQTIARLYSDEFAIIIDRYPTLGALSKQAELLIDKLGKTYRIDNRELYTGASIGISLYPNDGDNALTLLGQASIALQQAKRLGGNTWQFYTQHLSAQSRQHVELESDLRKAIRSGELEVFYQPKLNLRHSTITKAEALVRWLHPGKGLIPPPAFIPVAEQNGLIHPLGQWVLTQACQQAVEWLEAGTPIQVAVNISASQLKHGNLAKQVSDTLAQTGLPPRFLELELTESILMENREKHIHAFQSLRELGVAISIDDFGTGYSSLSYLKNLPLDVLKIDRSFITGLMDSDDCPIIRAMIAMAHELELIVVAEGVSDRGTLHRLRRFNCDEAQGNYIGQPLPAIEFIALLESWKSRTRKQERSEPTLS
ncbi:MAG: putative bifunctional diguanylate cyclase/phosphodiesterase [Endozoicomonas sp.]